MDKDWILRALAMHAALTTPPTIRWAVGDISKEESATEDAEALRLRAEAYAKQIGAFAQEALNKAVDPFS